MKRPLAIGITASLLFAAGGAGVPQAMAQSSPQEETRPLNTIPLTEVFDRAGYRYSKDFYENRSSRRQFQFMFGAGLPGRANFPDLEIERDAQLLNTIYRDALYQQVASDPTIRTSDLPNPFNTSILSSGGEIYSQPLGSFPLRSGELIFERVPPR